MDAVPPNREDAGKYMTRVTALNGKPLIINREKVHFGEKNYAFYPWIQYPKG